MCHSENRYDDKQNKNLWDSYKLCIENTYNRKQNKNRMGLQTVGILGKQIHR